MFLYISITLKCVEPYADPSIDEAGAGLLDGCLTDLNCRCAPNPLREESPIVIIARDTRHLSGENAKHANSLTACACMLNRRPEMRVTAIAPAVPCRP